MLNEGKFSLITTIIPAVEMNNSIVSVCFYALIELPQKNIIFVGQRY